MGMMSEFKEFAVKGNVVTPPIIKGAAFAIFMAVKSFNAMKKKEAVATPVAPAGPSKEEVLLPGVRDLLKQQK